MNTRLQVCVIVLNVINQFGKAPIGVGLRVQHVLLELFVDSDELFWINVADFLVQFIEVLVLLGFLHFLGCCFDSQKVLFMYIINVSSIVLFENGISRL